MALELSVGDDRGAEDAYCDDDLLTEVFVLVRFSGLPVLIRVLLRGSTALSPDRGLF
jgi:hypothetical protein